MYKMPALPTRLCKQYFLFALEYFHNIITSLHNYSNSLQWWVWYVVQSGTLNCYAATSSRLYHADTPIFHVNYWAELNGPQVLRVPAVITLTWICLFATNPFCRTSSSTNMQLLPYPNQGVRMSQQDVKVNHMRRMNPIMCTFVSYPTVIHIHSPYTEWKEGISRPSNIFVFVSQLRDHRWEKSVITVMFLPVI